MMFFINILEGLISGWALSELCDVKNKKLFITLITLFTLIAAEICGLFQLNSWPLLCLYVIGWFVIVSIFVRKSYVYNFFIAILCNYIINLSVFLPMIFLYETSIWLACLCAKVMQLIISYFFVLYRHKYSYVENKYWTPVLIILIASMIIMEDKLYGYFSGELDLTKILIIVLSFIVVGTSLIFFRVIEMFASENNELVKKLEREKYKDLSMSLIRHTNNETKRLQHEMVYRIMLIKAYLEENENENALKLVQSYMTDISKYSRVITTGNEMFDVLFSMKTLDLNFDLVKRLNMSVNDCYNNLEFINLILGLLSIIKDNITVYLDIEEVEKYSIIKFSSTREVFDTEEIVLFMKEHKEEYVAYTINKKEELYMLKLNIRRDDERDM